MKSFQKKCVWFLLPFLIGVAVFYIIPFVRVLYYSVIENTFSKKFVGWNNYRTVFHNEYFRLAMENSLLLIGIVVPVLVALAFFISLLLVNVKERVQYFRMVFVFPMLIPTASIAIVWLVLFQYVENVLPLWLLFIYKNLGILIILLSAALSGLDSAVYEAARLDGAAGIKLHWTITMPLMAPTLLFSVVIAIVYSFKIFRESYLYYGTNYPPDYGYTLQYYMNNHFIKLNYPYLAVGAVLTSVLIIALVVIGLKIQKRFLYA